MNLKDWLKNHIFKWKARSKRICGCDCFAVPKWPGGVLNNRGEYIEESALHAEHIMERPYEVVKVSKINETAVYLGLFIKQWYTVDHEYQLIL